MRKDLERILGALDAVEINLEKLRIVWVNARELLPSGPQFGGDPDYEELCRVWQNLQIGLPPIEGFSIVAELPNFGEIGQMYLDYLEIGEPPTGVYEEVGRPERDIDEYQFRIARYRRRLVSSELQLLMVQVGELLRRITRDLQRESSEKIATAETSEVTAVIVDIDRLVGDTVERVGSWRDLFRHMRFGQAIDWVDIETRDWPGVLPDIRAAAQSEEDPIPVSLSDIGGRVEVALGNIHLNIDASVARRLLGEADALMRAVGPGAALDRVQTAMHDYLRNACTQSHISWEREDSLVVLLKKLRSEHPQLKHLGPRNKDVARILNSTATIYDALLPLRSYASSAHPNELLDNAEANLVISVARALLEYLDAKLTEDAGPIDS